MENRREIFTPEQVAQYLQVDKETIYRNIRQGKLVASKLGRTYRITLPNIDLLLWAARTRKDITLRDYTGKEIAYFIRADQMDEESKVISDHFTSTIERKSTALHLYSSIRLP